MFYLYNTRQRHCCYATLTVVRSAVFPWALWILNISMCTDVRAIVNSLIICYKVQSRSGRHYFHIRKQSSFEMNLHHPTHTSVTRNSDHQLDRSHYVCFYYVPKTRCISHCADYQWFTSYGIYAGGGGGRVA